MWEIVTDFFKKEGRESQKVKEAKVDLLLIFMYIDDSLKLEESSLIRKITKEMKWENLELPIEAYINTTIPKIREALINHSKFDSLLDSIKERLGDKKREKEALELIKKLIDIDNLKDEKEINLFQKIRDKFNLK